MTESIIIGSEHKRLAKLCEALAHPTRLAIFEYILQSPQCLCKDITRRLPIVQSSVSQHLKKLKEAGLIIGKNDGTKNCYCVDLEVVRDFEQLMGAQFAFAENMALC